MVRRAPGPLGGVAWGAAWAHHCMARGHLPNGASCRGAASCGFRGIIEYPELEGTHKAHQIQLLEGTHKAHRVQLLEGLPSHLTLIPCKWFVQT